MQSTLLAVFFFMVWCKRVCKSCLNLYLFILCEYVNSIYIHSVLHINLSHLRFIYVSNFQVHVSELD